jgi:hypothetical protein
VIGKTHTTRISHVVTHASLALLLATSSAFAADKNLEESYFLALAFGNGNTLSIQLSNREKKEQSVRVERYSSSGSLLDSVSKAVSGNGNAEVRVDLSSSRPELGWIRVLSKGIGVDVKASLEMVEGDTLQTIPQGAAHRHPELTKQSLGSLPHIWTFDVANNLGFLLYFVNLSDYPVQVAMCQDERPGCRNPTLPYAVASMASISFPIDQSRRYAVIESTPGYSAVTSLRLTEGAKSTFEASSCIKFEGSTSCASQPLSPSKETTKFISPIQRQIQANVDASRSSPAMAAAQASGATAKSPEELAALIKNGNASKCVIVTEPPGAEIYIDGLKAGIAPLVFVLLKKGDGPRTVEIRMNGYRTIEKHLVPNGQLISISSTLAK